MPNVSVQSCEEVFAYELQPWRFGATMFGVFGALALVISAVGLYSVIAYVVTQRIREFGVRMAVGASPARVVGLVLLDEAQVIAAGGGLGIVTVLAAGHWLEPLLFQTSASDPVVMIAVAATLATTAVAASLVPAWRATRVNPMVALRPE